MTESGVTILFFAIIIAVFSIMTIWAVKLYVRNKRAGITSDKKTAIHGGSEPTWTNSDEFYMPGGLSYVHRHDEHPDEDNKD